MGARNVGLRSGGFAGRPGSRGELKWLDTTSTSAAVSVSGGLALLNGCAPGTGPSQRIGRRINMKSLILRFTFGAATASSTIFQGRIKIWIVADTQANATTPAFSDIFTAPAQCLANAVANLDNRDRFKVLWKKSVLLDQAGGHPAAYFDANIRLRCTTTYNAGTAGTVADIQTNALYLVAAYTQATSTVAPTNDPRLTYYARVRYSDD